ncbi:hypothetical protein [Burkholderia stagnalis]|uniref:hypothetical protein n=1 Tax=Burkholderia stagnalis TaxID=1503054 RepID=UPI000F5B8A72|nr:hypothetical protein [Burkholderia stagnalis]RQP98880.1 hypothetical protein DF164_31240 [Burkholderia stagnalis]RQY64932.1 hypothetical protein DF110_30765 [Burkholderia stagnalis]
MGRRKLEWADAELRLIMTGIEQSDRNFPQDNERFLDAVIDEIRTTTGRLYGAATYDRLIRTMPESMAITRRPSRTTIQKAIERAQALAATPVAGGDIAAEMSRLDAHLLRRALEPAVRDAVAPLQSWLVQLRDSLHEEIRPAGTGLASHQQFQVELVEASLHEAHARMRRLEEENGRLRRELGHAEARTAIAETRIAALLEELNRTIAASAAGANALVQAAQRLESTERFLKVQNDAVLQQATAEADALRRKVEQLRDQNSHLQIDNDQYRRALVASRSQKPE